MNRLAFYHIPFKMTIPVRPFRPAGTAAGLPPPGFSRRRTLAGYEGFSATKLATTGGFLKSGNTTLLLGVDDSRLEEAMGIIEKVCKSRTQIAASPVTMGGSGGMYASFPIEVTVGGATVFVLTVDQFVKY